ncbi:hypothetical protein [Nocardioides sp. SYSU DS0663]|uniref:hypothetical protein n=1 Tax=Nocardioides sp. SYSU DS0663 TaxID=3416445 RepID=UPI003F4BB739
MTAPTSAPTSALSATDHGRLRRAEDDWLRQSAERLRTAATTRRTTRRPRTDTPEQPR